MESYDLKIGGTALTLRKSQDVVALRPANWTAAGQLRAAADDAGGRLLGQRLGGFELVQIDGNSSGVEDSLNAMRTSATVDAGTHVFYTSDDKVPFVPTGSMYLKFKPETSPDAANALLDRYKLQVVETRGPDVLIARVTPGSPNPVKIAAELQDDEHVKVAEPDLATPGALTSFVVPLAEPLLDQQWHLRNTGKVGGAAWGLKVGADARVVEAWIRAQTLGSPDTIVAVIDDGFDLTHPDFAGPSKVVAPWDFTRNTAAVAPEFNANYPFFNSDQNEWSGDWHGTACAGVAVASAQGSGVLGAAPACRLMPIRWGRSLDPADVERWFRHAEANGAAVISCSWAARAANYPLPERIGDEIARCARKGRGGRGCIIVFAAGNERHDINAADGSTLNGLAVHPDVVAVAASTSRDEQAHYSNFGKAIAVCAPSSGAGGRGVTTTDVTGSFMRGSTSIASGYSPGPYTDSFGGTSSSTPLVAGICALLLSLRPDLTAAEVKDLLCTTARRIGAEQDYVDKHSVKYGYGCVDAAAAVAAAMALPAVANATTSRVARFNRMG